jgi:hypothetical protein
MNEGLAITHTFLEKPIGESQPCQETEGEPDEYICLGSRFLARGVVLEEANSRAYHNRTGL